MDETTPTMVGGEDKQIMTLRNHVTLGAHGQTLSITGPHVTTNSFYLKPMLIFMVQESKFTVQLWRTPIWIY